MVPGWATILSAEAASHVPCDLVTSGNIGTIQ